MKEGQDSGAISCQSLNLCTSSHWRSSSPLLRFVSKHKLPEFDKILVPSYPTSFLYSENDSEMSLTEFLSVHFHPCKVKGCTEGTTRSGIRRCLLPTRILLQVSFQKSRLRTDIPLPSFPLSSSLKESIRNHPEMLLHLVKEKKMF